MWLWPLRDLDHDGLCDSWEVAGGIDLNGDGKVNHQVDRRDGDNNDVDNNDDGDVLLPGADPHRPDIYLQYDYMVLPSKNGHSHRPHREAIQAVVDAFARQGIALHAFRGHRLPHYTVVTFDPVDPACAGDDAVNFFDLKARSLDPRKALVYHYAIFAHYNTCGTGAQCSLCPTITGFGGGGKAELPGNDSIISLGAFLDIIGVAPGFEQEAGIFMHELGHNFGLRHGGNFDLPDFKPNYLSVVNGNFAYPGIPVAAEPGSIVPMPCRKTADCPAEAICGSFFSHTCARIDYSRDVLPDLNEMSLYESVGIGAWTNDITAYSCPAPDFTTGFGPGTGPIDWNCNGDASETNVTADINSDSHFNLDNIFLLGHRDWGSLNFHFQCTANGLDPPGAHPRRQREQREPTIPDAIRKHVLFAPRAVEVTMVGAQPGELAVAILGADDLDTTDIDRSSLKLAGATPARTRFGDVNGDGRADLVLTFDVAGPRLFTEAGPRHLRGWLKNSQAFVARVRP